MEFDLKVCYDFESTAHVFVNQTIECGKRFLMEKEIIFVVEESPEGGYEARALGFSIFTQAETFDDLKKMVQDAVLCHFDEEERPKVIRLHMVREELLAV